MDSYRETITVNSEIPSYEIDYTKVKMIADMVRQHLGVAQYELAITFVDSEEIQQLNRDYRGKDSPTDVLSFPQQEWREPLRTKPAAPIDPMDDEEDPPEILGDIVISLPDAEKNAQQIGQGLDREVCFLIVHGVLHLCGHDHMEPEEEKIMLHEQNQLMQILSSQGGGTLWRHCVRTRGQM